MRVLLAAPAQVWNWHHPEMRESADYFCLPTGSGPRTDRPLT